MSTRSLPRRLVAAFAILALAAFSASSHADFPLKDGDTWVMAGDSITAQHLHTNYMEAFCYARYPNLAFHFRNSGVGGDTITKVIDRFAWDVALWNPTVVSVELGMNDQWQINADQYIANMTKLTEKIKAAGARPVFFTSSPMNNGDTLASLGHGAGNSRLDTLATRLKDFAAKQQAPFTDQFHELVEVWSIQKSIENRNILFTNMHNLAKEDKLAGVDHLRAFLDEQAKIPTPTFTTMGGDAVHPGFTGQLTMAAALLKGLSADPFVSSATIDASAKTATVKACTVDNLTADPTHVSFDRLDNCLPFPIPSDARAAVAIYPAILDLSQYTLTVTGLAKGSYSLSIDNKPADTYTSDELAAGINLTKVSQGVIPDQMQEILADVNAKEGLVGTWRGLPKPNPNAPADLKEKLADLAKKIDEADAKTRAAAKPHKLHFQLAPSEPAPAK